MIWPLGRAKLASERAGWFNVIVRCAWGQRVPNGSFHSPERRLSLLISPLKNWLPHLRRFALLFAFIVPLSGCGGEEPPAPTPAPAKPAPAPAKKPVAPVKPVESAKVEDVLTPHLNVTIDGTPIELKGCHATLGLGVLQVQNYDADAETETYPQIFLRAKPDVDNLKSLEGNTIDAQVFVQTLATSLP